MCVCARLTARRAPRAVRCQGQGEGEGFHLALGPFGRVPVALHRLVGRTLAGIEVERVVLFGEKREEVGRARAHLLACVGLGSRLG